MKQATKLAPLGFGDKTVYHVCEYFGSLSVEPFETDSLYGAIEAKMYH